MIYRIKTNGKGYRTLKIKKGEDDVALLLTEKGFDEMTERMTASACRMLNLMEGQLRLLMTPEQFDRFKIVCTIDASLIQHEVEAWMEQNIKEL